MHSLLLMVGLVVLAVLYGLAWHNEPAREPNAARDRKGRAEPQPPPPAPGAKASHTLYESDPAGISD